MDIDSWYKQYTRNINNNINLLEERKKVDEALAALRNARKYQKDRLEQRYIKRLTMIENYDRDTKTCRMVAEDIVCIYESLSKDDVDEIIWRLVEDEYQPYNTLKHHDIDMMYKENLERFGDKYSKLEENLARKCLRMLSMVNPEDEWVS